LGLGGFGLGGPGYSADWIPSQVGDESGRQPRARPPEPIDDGADLGGSGDVLIATAHLKNTHVYTDALLPDTAGVSRGFLETRASPSDTCTTFGNGWTGGLLANIGFGER